ncbi:FAD:protein FMN transferase [Amycolatopsis sp. OK19-0408]|uniref:FAD:protein FMN transferase n=1 Tax=Amycolatopsis iheyensis TaxID=2945988 RepID=A0A9X2SNH4_9PSEU|nr:FAD:protein FMN transferase [Amycolatopsis iheyensis]MCR6488048.1 FAD:protein FMN transferase [Amycolatopsis iheyensis]
MTTAARAFPALGTTAEVLVTDPRRLDAAVSLLRAELAAIDLACSRFRPDSEISRLHERAGRQVQVGALLAEALGVALRAARLTDGLVDPTVGAAVRELGYDRDFALVTDSSVDDGRARRAGPAAGDTAGGGESAAADPACGPAAAGRSCGPVAAVSACGPVAAGWSCGPVAADPACGPAVADRSCGPAAAGWSCGPVAADPACGPAAAGWSCGPAAGAEPAPVPAPGWHRVLFDPAQRLVVLPRGVHLDLGATAKALAADRAARRIHAALGCGVLVNLGGDLSAQGPTPAGGWQVALGDDHADARSDTTVALSRSLGLASSGTTRRRWRRGGRTVHHIVDPRTGDVAQTRWRTVTVAAKSTVDANTASTAAIVLGAEAPAWLANRRLPARLVGVGGDVVTTTGWPAT